MTLWFMYINIRCIGQLYDEISLISRRVNSTLDKDKESNEAFNLLLLMSMFVSSFF